ncbi:hypothetical protein BJY04DRAFT_51803 [Aspergillus karnatakaensis]|uniref:uncharacterized protein n=1 Tax=Aspergillus karnatakaensis TaxID=1810916 RepID=UPI003CCDFC87
MTSALREAKDTLTSAIGSKPTIKNKNEGGSGGTDFTLTHGNHAVTEVHVWVDKGSANWSDRDLVKAIQVTWSDGKVSTVKGNSDNHNEAIFSFEDAEKVKDMTLHTGDRVDKIAFNTTQDNDFAAGGEYGSAHDQKVGNGVLLGFKGSFNSEELISLGSIFDEDHK